MNSEPSHGRPGPAGPLLLAGLNPQQREAVLATDGPVLILAGAGSGKTRVITHRIAHLVLDKGVPSESILAVTFTNKAAGEMKERAEALLPGQPLRAVLSTFHSFCVRVLRRNAEAAGLPRDFVIYDEDDQVSAVRAALRALDLPEKLHPPRRVLARISARKNVARGAAAEEAEDDSVATATLSRIAERYRQTLDAAGALDFDDLLLRTVALLDRDPGVREAYRRRFPYVLVDEYQDTNRAQYGLPGSAGPAARGELPVQPGHPGRGRGARGPQPPPQGQDPARGESGGRRGAPPPGRG